MYIIRCRKCNKIAKELNYSELKERRTDREFTSSYFVKNIPYNPDDLCQSCILKITKED